MTQDTTLIVFEIIFHLILLSVLVYLLLSVICCLKWNYRYIKEKGKDAWIVKDTWFLFFWLVVSGSGVAIYLYTLLDFFKGGLR